ncbi:uncharacterized protein LOC132544442 [Ylistrum balloti]|uniref:uncharacterized protein LOC132544442 n=1 Tax=Ylistrum balloti TaxID=509963 RepID=UPI002905D7B9|nr:uncharacterized protein LOC132544442 [Ylistrum balloti]
MEPHIDFYDIMNKLERRFGFKELPETSQAILRSAKQWPDKSLADWADRVPSISTKAYKDLPDEYMYQQAILTICQGALDKEAGQHTAMEEAQSIQEVAGSIKKESLEKKVNSLESKINDMEKTMRKFMSNLYYQRRQDPITQPSQKAVANACFHCGEEGHFKVNCPQLGGDTRAHVVKNEEKVRDDNTGHSLNLDRSKEEA